MVGEAGYVGRAAKTLTGPKITVLIADDHALFRVGLANLLARDDSIEVVGQAGDGAEAIDQVRLHRPDVVLMDVMMPKFDGLEATRIIHCELPETAILVLSAYDDYTLVGQALAAGARGFVHKNSTISEVIRAILATSPPKRGASDGHGHRLSRREVVVLQGVAAGLSNKQIARRLAISEKTVRNHLTRVYGKMGTTNRTEAVMHALKSGVVVA